VSESRPTREAYYRVLAESISQETLVVTSLGNASYVWSNVCDRPENFYLEDAMGLALPLALGLAVSQPERRVVVAEGDGGLMMHLGALITVGSVAPRNLTVLLVNNNIHAASGGQPLTNTELDLADLARSAGVRRTESVGSLETFRALLPSALVEEGPSILVLATEPDVPPVKPAFPMSPPITKQRFMDAIGVPRYVPAMFRT
jgi:sulfopyruvate decarboxylase subunit beta